MSRKMNIPGKLKMLMLITVFYQLSVCVDAQEVNLQLHNATLKECMQQIEEQTQLGFLFNGKGLHSIKGISIDVKNTDLNVALAMILGERGYDFEIRDNVILIRKKSEETSMPAKQQNASIKLTGVVTDAELNQPMVGVNVYIKGTTNGTITNINGAFELEVTEQTGKLVFSFLGYDTQEFLFNKDTRTFSVALISSVSAVDEVVVYATGYTKISKERATGSYSLVDEKTIENLPVEEISGALEGMATGVQVKTDSEGNITNVEIRGRSTISSNAKPLVVVDGFPVEGDFSTINPGDVANITILKDAAAASIWGARAGNGVIVITTKQNKTKDLKISVESFIKVGDKPDLDYLLPSANNETSIAFQKWVSDNGYGTTFGTPNNLNNLYMFYSHANQAYFDFSEGRISQSDLDNTIAGLKGIDFKEDINKYLIQNSFSHQHSVSLSGGSDNGTYNLSTLYNGNRSNMAGSNREKLLINLRTNYNLAKWLKLDFAVMTEMKNNHPNNVSLYTITNRISPYQNLIDSDGTYANVINYKNYRLLDEWTSQIKGMPYDNWRYNPLQEARETNKKFKDWNNRIQVGLNFNLMDGLTYRGSFQFERFAKRNKTIYGEETYFVRSSVNDNVDYDEETNTITRQYMPKGSILNQYFYNIQTYTFRNQLNYNKVAKEKHELNVAIGTETNWRETEGFSDNLYGYNDGTLTFVEPPYGYGSSEVQWSLLTDPWGNGRIPSGNSLSSGSYRFFSVYGNLSYTFDHKYTLSGSYRTDASNMIVKDPKYRYSPMWSVGGSWNAKQESFLIESDIISRLIGRFTYGVNGNIVPTASTVPLVALTGSPSTVTGEISARITTKGNPTLRWEKVVQFNTGLDFALFDHKVFGSLDYYNKHSKDLLAAVSIPSTLGSTNEVFNVAELQNRGIELDANYKWQGKSVQWTTGLKYSYNKSEVVSLDVKQINANYMLNGIYDYSNYIQGYPYQPVFAWRYGGLDPETGDPLIVNDKDPSIVYSMNDLVGNNGEYGPDVLQYMGSAIAPHVAGWTNTINFKNFTFQAVIIGKFGHVFRRPTFTYNATPMYVGYYHKDLEQIWSGNAESLGLPPLPDGYLSTLHRWRQKMSNLNTLVESASHIRLREIYLAYSLPKTMVSKMGMTNLKFFTRAENLGLLWKANQYDLDPEYISGVTFKPVPTYTLGLSLVF